MTPAGTDAGGAPPPPPPPEPVTSTVPFGEWPSPLTPWGAAGGAPRFAGLGLGRASDGTAVLWFAHAAGGSTPVQRVALGDGPDGGPDDAVVTPLHERARQVVQDARSRVNEYGGGAFWVHRDTLFWVDDGDQRIRRVDVSGSDPSPVALTGRPPVERAWRHAAGVVDPTGSWMVVEREVHCDDEGRTLDQPRNDLAWIRCRPGPDGVAGAATTLVSGPDFCAAPTLSPDGAHLAWLQWDHPDMPWDAAEMWAGEVAVDPSGDSGEVLGARRVAGGRDDRTAHGLGRAVAVCLPSWSPAGELWFCDDRDDTWSLRSSGVVGLPQEGGAEGGPVQFAGEVGEPRWVSGGGRYGFLADGSFVAAVTTDGLDRIVRVDAEGRRDELGPGGTTRVEELVAGGETVVAVVGQAEVPTSVVAMLGADTPSPEVMDVSPTSWPLPEGSISVPEPISFSTGPDGTDVAHGLLYRPVLEGVSGPPDELPPLLVRIHGGPTAHARAELSSSIQFWTTRGFAVVEVNHRGSTGFGRRFRDLLLGGWGVVEVQDCIAAAAHLAATGVVDPARCVIRGGSAGGFTALEAVSAPPTAGGFRFAAATTLYGVTDLAAMASESHKFEIRYLDGLVGPLPETADVYRERSPLHHAERIAAPVLVLQGLDDMVVPPSQAEVLVAALAANGIEHEYRTYAGEGHGFRRTETVADALEAELAFYGRVLGFAPR